MVKLEKEDAVVEETWSSNGRVFLKHFAWPVLKAHREFVAFNFFDNGSLFHSCLDGYEGAIDQGSALQIHRSSGVSANKHTAENADNRCDCSLYLMEQRQLFRVNTTNRVALELLRSGSIERFLKEAGCDHANPTARF